MNVVPAQVPHKKAVVVTMAKKVAATRSRSQYPTCDRSPASTPALQTAPAPPSVPDLVFLWDEAWFAFARFHPVYRRRTAMAAACQLLDRYRSAGYRATYAEYRRHLGAEPADACLLGQRLLPDPDAAQIRVYVTQSTHKTLTSLRQGSMIHVFDQDFNHKVEETFREAYMTHTSTSPNYQILASLDSAAVRPNWKASSYCKNRSSRRACCATRSRNIPCCTGTCVS
jgi:arginine/lysine/ornithine decarboxylase